MAEPLYTLPQLTERLQKPFTTLLWMKELLPLCPCQRDEHGRNLYGPRDISLMYRELFEHDHTARSESAAAAREEYLAVVAPPGCDRKAALEAEFDRITLGEVEATNEQINALLEALEAIA